jgi:hypothetical protein
MSSLILNLEGQWNVASRGEGKAERSYVINWQGANSSTHSICRVITGMFMAKTNSG